MNQATQQPSNQATPLRGWVATFHINHNGKRLGPYHVRRWKVGKHVRKEYIKPADLEKVKARCQAYREKRERGRIVDRKLYNLLGNLDYLVRLCKRLKKGPLRPEDNAYCARIAKEGYEISGRPRIRRVVTSPYLQIPIDEIIEDLRRRLAYEDHLTHAFQTFTNPNPESASSAFRAPRSEFERGFMVPQNDKNLVNSDDSEFRVPSSEFAGPLLSRRDLAQTKKDAKRILREMRKAEPSKEMWARWNKDHAKLPKPPPVWRPELPAWLTYEEIEQKAAEATRAYEARAERGLRTSIKGMKSLKDLQTSRSSAEGRT